MASLSRIEERPSSPSSSDVPCGFHARGGLVSLGQSQQLQLFPSGGCDHDILACYEDGSSLGAFQEPVHRDPPGTALAAAANRPADAFNAEDVRDVIRSELTRLQETPFVPRLPEARRFAEDNRPRIVSWLVQVVSALELAKETLHSAVSLLDRYISGTEAHPPEAVLQLLALGCLSAAAKYEEVAQRSSDEWVRLAVDEDRRNLYERLDLHRMEWLLLETVEWRIRVPNTLTFMRQYQAVLVNRGVIASHPKFAELFKSYSEFMAEISLLYSEFLAFGYSTVAVACLTLAEWYCQSLLAGEPTPVHAPAVSLVLELAAFADMDASFLAPGLAECMEFMNHLYQIVTGRSAWGSAVELGLLEPVVARYPHVATHIGQ